MLLEKCLVDLARDRELGLQLADPSLRGGQLNRLIGAQPSKLSAIDAVLLEPHRWRLH
jgi:hypothetical protein